MRLYSREYRRLYLNGSERTQFFETAQNTEPHIRYLCLILLFTGCRLSEVLNINTNDIQWHVGIIAIRSLKKRNQQHVREIAVPQQLLDEMHVALQVKTMTSNSQLIFTQSRTTAWRQIKSVMCRCNIYGIHATPRGLRHSFGVHCAMNNVPMPLTQKWMGHSTLKVTAIYYQIVGPEERVMASRLWGEFNLPVQLSL